MRLGFGFATLAVLVFASPLSAGGVRCEDIARERARGKSPSEVVEALGTSRTRIAACAQLAADREHHENHQAQILERQARRRAAD